MELLEGSLEQIYLDTYGPTCDYLAGLIAAGRTDVQAAVEARGYTVEVKPLDMLFDGWQHELACAASQAWRGYTIAWPVVGGQTVLVTFRRVAAPS